MTKSTGPRRSWCFGEYYHTTDPVGCNCAEDLEPGSKHDVTAMTTHETLIQELQDALKRERQLRMTAQGKLALAREPEYEALRNTALIEVENRRLREALKQIAGSWIGARGIARRALKIR